MNLNLSRQTGHIKLTELALWQPTFPQLCRAFSTPKIDADKLNAGYYLRCAGTKRGNDTVSDNASLLILDGDSRLVDGEIVSGAVNPQYVHMMLNHLNIDHFMYTSHSNAPDLWKYRVLMPVEYTRQQLPALLDWIFTQFHDNSIDLINVKENASWSQAWFMPCMPAEQVHLFKTWWRVGDKSSNPLPTDCIEPAQPFDAELIYNEWLARHKAIANQSITAHPIGSAFIISRPDKVIQRIFYSRRNSYQKWLHESR